MSLELRKRLFDQLDGLTLIDPHTHINPLDPAAHSLADILGYHYYTELAHSAGLSKAQIEDPDLEPRERVRRLIEHLEPLDNTAQYHWFLEICRTYFGLQTDDIGAVWEGLYDASATVMSQPDWPAQVLAKSKLEAVFLTNDFDDPLEGFDTSVYIPCLRTDDLVFHLARPEVRQRLERATGVAAADGRSLKRAIGQLFEHFKSRGARACAISLPPDFTPTRVSPARANTALAAIHADGTAAAESHRRALANFVFWTLAEMCDAYRLPFDLMIGVNRSVYEGGVHQGRDLFDSRVSLVQYKELLNAFPRVTFPISVLASSTNQELTSFAWIFPNVVAHGHWWYSNTPTYIEHDLTARLEAAPRNKQIGYYSDMYKLEFALPKFAMYKRILARVLADRFVLGRGWSEERAAALGAQVLRGNVESVFRWGEDLRGEMPSAGQLDPVPSSAAGFAAPVSGIAAAALLGAAEDALTSNDIDSPYYQPPADTGLGGIALGFSTAADHQPLREPDEQVMIPVPADADELAAAGELHSAEMSAAAADALDLADADLGDAPSGDADLDDGSFDLEEAGGEAASAGGIGKNQPPSLEVVEEETLDLFDSEENLELADAAPTEVPGEALPFEEADAADSQAGRMTEPFPILPDDNEETQKPDDDAWGFLNGR